jgi:hypothetical protein
MDYQPSAASASPAGKSNKAIVFLRFPYNIFAIFHGSGLNITLPVIGLEFG